MTQRRTQLERARLYLVCGEMGDAFLDAVLEGGADIVQLRLKDAPDGEIVAAGRRFADRCAAHDALLIINDRPDLVSEIGADGVHVGQDDIPVAEARELVGPDRVVGLSTHSPAQIDAAGDDPQIDYIGVGPVHATPTKPGRPAVGIELVRYAARHASVPFFAIGGIDAENAAVVAAAGARRIAVVRALTDAADPAHAARALRVAVTGREARVAAT